MLTVYRVSRQDFQSTHLILPATAWGTTIRERLSHMGYSVQATDQAPHPDTRDAAELARRDALLEWAAPE